MIRFLMDENFNAKIIRGLRVRIPALDVIRVQDTEIFEADDPTVLEWATEQGRILLTHDFATMTKYANERIENGLSHPEVVFVHTTLPVARAIEDLILIASASEPNEWINRNIFLPL